NGDSARSRDADGLVLIGAEVDRKESESKVGRADAQLVDEIVVEDVRLAQPQRVALVLGSAGAESRLEAGNAAGVAERIVPVTAAEEDGVALLDVVVEAPVEIVVGALLLTMRQVVMDGTSGRRHRIGVEISLADRIDQVGRNHVARERLSGRGVVDDDGD